jgi:hypothetical protein
MAAEHIVLADGSYAPTADYSAAATYQYHFMKSVAGVLTICGAGDPILGILQDTPSANMAGSVALEGESYLVVDGNAGAIAAMDRLKSDASGQGVKTTSNGDEVGAVALEAATTAGAVIKVHIVHYRY